MPNESFESGAGRIPRRFAQAVFALSLAGSVTANTNVAIAQPKTASEPKVASAAPPRPQAPNFRTPYAPPRYFDGVASYYSEDLLVATGARFDPTGFTAAHRSLPFGTRVRVSDPSTRRSVVITINDRGPFVPGRVLDLSLGAARALGMQDRGVSRVHGEVLHTGGGALKTLAHFKTTKASAISASDTKRPMGNVRRPVAPPGKADAKASHA